MTRRLYAERVVTSLAVSTAIVVAASIANHANVNPGVTRLSFYFLFPGLLAITGGHLDLEGQSDIPGNFLFLLLVDVVCYAVVFVLVSSTVSFLARLRRNV